ncbi:MAG: hypothetical protein ACKVE4_04260 [Dissulfuribacterales bacterium]
MPELFEKILEKAALEYDKFNKVQKIESDFDREIKKLGAGKKTRTKSNGEK